MIVPVVVGYSSSVCRCSKSSAEALYTVIRAYPYVLDRKAEYAGCARVKGSWCSLLLAQPSTM